MPSLPLFSTSLSINQLHLRASGACRATKLPGWSIIYVPCPHPATGNIHDLDSSLNNRACVGSIFNHNFMTAGHGTGDILLQYKPDPQGRSIGQVNLYFTAVHQYRLCSATDQLPVDAPVIQHIASGKTAAATNIFPPYSGSDRCIFYLFTPCTSHPNPSAFH